MKKWKLFQKKKQKIKLLKQLIKKTDNTIENKVNKVETMSTHWNKETINYNSLKNEYWSLEKVPFFKLYNEVEQDYLDKYVSLEQLDPVSKNPSELP